MSENVNGDVPTFGGVTRRAALKGTTIAAALGITAALSDRTGAVGASTRFGFHGAHQSGIATTIQRHVAFATFDVTTKERAQLIELLKSWTSAAANLVEGHSLTGYSESVYPPSDTGEVIELGPSGLTLTFGFGPTLFDERFGLTQRRPAALIELPKFPGDNLDPVRTGGDLCVQACSDDPLVAFHAVRNLARMGLGAVALRDVQFGTGATSTSEGTTKTPRNLLGFKDGTSNLEATNIQQMNRHVWVSNRSDQPWMYSGSYLVMRRIRVHLEQWSSLALHSQERVIGRRRSSGAPLTGQQEHDPLLLDKYDSFGQPTIPENAHVRTASHQQNNGARILRRGFNFADGVDPRTGELDAGLLFICFQNDPRRQFVTIQNNLAIHDSLSRYVEHTASGIFACPPGVTRGAWLGHGLFE